MKITRWILTFLAAVAIDARGADTADLAGDWKFRRDDDKAGVREQWFAAPLAGNAKIKLPGTMDDAQLGIPNPVKPSLADLWRPNVYEGAAWYQREINIPESWHDRRVTLFLERCRWVTQAWLDGQLCGESLDSLIAPHVHLLGIGLQPGRHTLTLLVDNTKKIDLGTFVSALYGGTQGNLNGIVGKIELRATPLVWIDDVQVYPDWRTQSARVHVRIGNATGQAGASLITIKALQSMVATNISWTPDGGAAEYQIALSNTPAWDEFHPALSALNLELNHDASTRRRVVFGLRELGRRGTQFTMNGRPLFLRGTLECQVFPLTGHPPCDVPAWRRIFQIEKSYGLNFIRFHSWCPPEAAFAAADLEGIMIQAEAPQANVPAGANPARDAFTEAELLRMVHTYGNHPSFCLMTLGNEYGGKSELLTHWVDRLIQEDPRHLYSSASCAQTTTNRQWTEGTFGRGVHGAGTMADVRAAIARETVPPVGHEIGQWVVFPNFDEMKKYTGVMQPKNFEIIRDDLKAKGMLDLAPQFFKATGQQSVRLYKEEIELLLRTPGFAGFSLLDLHDYPSQGTALIGLLDPFWDSKGLIQPAEHRRYCGAVVPLLRLPKRTWTADETFSATAEIANYGAADLTGKQPFWKITNERGQEIAQGKLAVAIAPTGQLSPLGPISASLVKVSAPAKLTVTVGLTGTKYSNCWNLWVYPGRTTPQPPVGVIVSTAWDETAKAALAGGKTVLLLPANKWLHHSLGGSFLPTFWSPVWFPSQRPDTMSILCDPRHPLFAQFPTEFYSDWQWYDLQPNSRSLILDDTPAAFRPLVQVIDNFARNHKLGSVFEARVGKGKLLVCAIELAPNRPKRPATQQFARSLFAYLASPNFKPQAELPFATLDRLFAPAISGLHVAHVRTDSEQPGFEATNAVDGDATTMWHTAWDGDAPKFPHWLELELDSPEEFAGFTVLPRQDGNHNGWIKDYALYLSQDGSNWGKPVAAGTFPANDQLQTVKFASPVTAKFVKLVALSGYAGGPWASLAEFNLVQPPLDSGIKM